MTTIVWDGRTLAVDSLRTAGGIIESYETKKLFLDVGNYVAATGCGDYQNVLQFIAWLRGDKDVKFPTDKEDNGSGIAINKDGELMRFLFSGAGVPFREGSMFSDGSGWELAIGALEAGADAEKALGIAIKRDAYTGGNIQKYTINEGSCYEMH